MRDSFMLWGHAGSSRTWLAVKCTQFTLITAISAPLSMLGTVAQGGEFDGADACLQTQIDANQPIAKCVHGSQAICLSFDAPSMSGADCYRRAKVHWGDLISQRMTEIGNRASEEVAAIAGIEVKYDLKSNLTQCDRMEELALVQRDPDQETVYLRMRCEATAVGLAYAKLYFQSSRLK